MKEVTEYQSNKLTKMAMKPQTLAADYIAEHLPILKGMEAHDVGDVLIELLEQSKNVRRDKTGVLEDMLLSQAMVLNSVFYKHLDKSGRCQTLDEMKLHMNMALKAQSQSRCTAEALVEVKNPRPYFQQNNLAHTQQVNNHLSPAHGENPKATNELLTDGGNQHETMDFSRAKKAIRANTELEAVGAFNRAKDGKRQGIGEDERV